MIRLIVGILIALSVVPLAFLFEYIELNMAYRIPIALSLYATGIIIGIWGATAMGENGSK